MAAIARIAVISAVFYLVRFALATHQHRTQSKHSDSDSKYSFQGESASNYEESNEKVLIRSGVPLRGRTIHQTAWSEDEKSTMVEKDTLQQPDDENKKEKVYDSMSLKSAINYLLSFIYNTEVDGDAIISKNLAENSNEILNIPKRNFDEKRTHQTSIKINDPKEISENIPKVSEDSVLEVTTNYPIGNLQNEDMEWFRNEISISSDEYTSTESDTENSELSNEIADSEYEEESYKHQDYDTIYKDKVDEMHNFGSVKKDTNDDSMRNNIAKSLTEIREKEPEFVSVEKSLESKPKSDINKYQENDLHTNENTKTDSDKNKIMNYNGYDMNIWRSTNRHPEQPPKSKTMKGFVGTESSSHGKNTPAEPLSVEDTSTQKSIKQDVKQSNENYDKNDEGSAYLTTGRTSIENIITEIPPTTSRIQNQTQSQNKYLPSKSYPPTQTKKPKVSVVKNNLGKKHEVNRLFVTTENFNEFQHQKVFKSSNNATKTPVKFADKTQTYNQSKISSNSSKKVMDYKSASITKKIPVVPRIKSSQFPSVKPLEDRHQQYLKSKQKYLSDIYLDLEPDEDIRSYNYLLDSYEFIKVDNDRNKVNKKHDNSIYVIIQDKDHGSEKETSTILSAPFTPFKDQREVEVIDKSHESFDTILEYLYKNSNSSFILSLRDYNSSEI